MTEVQMLKLRRNIAFDGSGSKMAIRPVHTLVKGRGRFFIPGLKRSGQLKAFLEGHLTADSRILSFSASIVTGKLLVTFDEKIQSRQIQESLEALVQSAGKLNGKSPVQIEMPGDKNKKSTAKKAFEKLHSLIKPADLPAEKQWHTCPSKEVISHFETDPKEGISTALVEHRRSEYGENILPKTTARSGLQIFGEQMNSLPVYLLGAAAGVSILTGGLLDATIIFGVVVANGIIGYVTESKAEKNIDALNGLVQHMAEVIRDGKPVFISAEEVVPGDLLVLKPGSYVPADCRIIKASQLTIDESMLTGENLPVQKSAHPIKDPKIVLADRKNMAFMGTCITGGQGLAVVVSTGRNTEIGKLKILLNNTDVPQMPIERQLDSIGNQLILISGVVCTGVFGLGLMMGFGFLNMLRMSISLAAAAVPEGLPAMATINFAIGINRMKKNNIVVRQLPAVETLGAIQTICLDKTGTITKNQMEVTSIYAGDNWIKVEENTFRINGEEISPTLTKELEKLYAVCALCCETKINGKCPDGRLDISGSATESALTELVAIAGIHVKKFRKASPLLKINHRSEQRLYMSTVHKTEKADRQMVTVKGSPLEVLARCNFIIKNNERVELTDSDRKSIENANRSMAQDALRVLGFAYCYTDDENCECELEINMTWLGLVGMMDPPRAGIKQLIGQFHRAGVRTVMITGDQQISASAIAADMNLSGGEPLQLMDATDLVRLDEEELKEKARNIHVFSRVTPSQKLKIVKAIQASGQVVAMTGDGINDSPALKAADIGIAMGESGTDLARDVADVVLTKDNLELMATTLADGRSIYQNIKKSVHYSLATNISEIQLIATATALRMSSPLNVMQLLWINLISDILPGLALSAEKPENDVMDQKPRDPEEEIFEKKDFGKMMVESSVMTGGAMASLFYGISRYGAGARAGGLAFQALTLGQLLHAFTCRSETSGIFTKKRLPKNRHLNWAIGGSVALQISTIFFPPLRSLLGLTSIGLADGLVIGAASTIPLLVKEAGKAGKEKRADAEMDKRIEKAVDITEKAERTPEKSISPETADIKCRNGCN